MEQRSSNGHALTWVMVLMLTPVLYVLSIPPVAVMCRPGPAPAWLITYIKPGNWICDRSPKAVQEALRDYTQWWMDL